MWLKTDRIAQIVFCITVLSSVLCDAHFHQLYLHDECIVSRTKQNGTCRFVDDCPIVVIEALEQSLYPTLCGFQDRNEIICCPNYNKPAVNPVLISEKDAAVSSNSTRISVQSIFCFIVL